MESFNHNEFTIPSPSIHPLSLFHEANTLQSRPLYISAPMVRYSKLAFRQTVHALGTDLVFTPMILSKEFNRSHIARDTDLTLSSRPLSSSASDPQSLEIPTIVQFGASSAVEFARSSSLVAPFVNGVDLNCGCPQSWACGEGLGASLISKREVVLDMVTQARERLRQDGWGVNCEHSAGLPATGADTACRDHWGDQNEDENDGEDGGDEQHNTHDNEEGEPEDEVDPLSDDEDHAMETTERGQNARKRKTGKSISIKIRIHPDLRRTTDFLDAILASSSPYRNIDFLTIHPRTKNTPSSTSINVEALKLLCEKYGKRVPIVLSGDVFTLDSLPFTMDYNPVPSPRVSSSPGHNQYNTNHTTNHGSNNTTTNTPKTNTSNDPPSASTPLPHIPHLKALMSARPLLSNPALFTGSPSCPWSAVDLFMHNLSRANLPLKLVLHHVNEMLGPGFAPDRGTLGRDGGKSSLVGKGERARMLEETKNFGELVDFIEEVREKAEGWRGE